jgi:pre-mRNA-splicing factor ISY1
MHLCFIHSSSFTGVRELFEQEPMPVPKKSRAELMKDIDADYYGYRDDDDGILIPLEQEAEKEGMYFKFICMQFTNLGIILFKAVAKAVAEWQAKKEAGLLESDKNYGAEENIYTTRKLKVCFYYFFPKQVKEINGCSILNEKGRFRSGRQ